MRTLTPHAAATGAYSQPASRAEILADALGRIITGRPLPAGLCPAPVVVAVTVTVEEGISRILTGAAGRTTA